MVGGQCASGAATLLLLSTAEAGAFKLMLRGEKDSNEDWHVVFIVGSYAFARRKLSDVGFGRAMGEHTFLETRPFTSTPRAMMLIQYLETALSRDFRTFARSPRIERQGQARLRNAIPRLVAGPLFNLLLFLLPLPMDSKALYATEQLRNPPSCSTSIYMKRFGKVFGLVERTAKTVSEGFCKIPNVILLQYTAMGSMCIVSIVSEIRRRMAI